MIQNGKQFSSSNASVIQYQNVGKSEILGLEFAAEYFILDNLSIKANCTYMDSKTESNDGYTNGDL
ncbi:hypothetical protein [Aliarcobacter butzleri]|uniref:hypothetical protein n=1 Tax=Aliarcobacter butzleri TaxID=28197 RepID=UPI003AFB0041